MTQTNSLLVPPPASGEEAGNGHHPRNLPCNIEAEQALLGAILINNAAHERVSDFLRPEHFFDPLHGRIYNTMQRLLEQGKNATPITLKTFFEDEEPINPDLTVPQYLGRLAAEATTIINAREYGRTIYDLARRRALIGIGEEMVNTAYHSSLDNPPEAQIEQAEQKLYELAESGKYGKGFESFHHALRSCIEMASAAYERRGGLSGISTGLKSLDMQMGGLQKSDLIIIAGRPSMGKTALATNIAFNIARATTLPPEEGGQGHGKEGAVVGFFSLEMSSEQLATRIVSEQARIPSENIRRGMISDDEFRELVRVARELEDMPLFIDPTGGITIAQLAARARRLKRQHDLGVIVVDYLQLLSGSSALYQTNRVQEITEITTGLKALAKELEVPVIALSQLSRQVEQREDKRPQLADLRESGSIEQDADVVMFVYREEYYVARSEPSMDNISEHELWQDKMDRVMGMAEVIIAKQRHGPVGSVKLQFTGEYTRFSDLADESRLPARMG